MKAKKYNQKKFETTIDDDTFIYTEGDILSSGMFDNEDLQEIMNLKVGEVYKVDMCGDSLKRIK